MLATLVRFGCEEERRADEARNEEKNNENNK
jgi:hypothetical protein